MTQLFDHPACQMFFSHVPPSSCFHVFIHCFNSNVAQNLQISFVCLDVRQFTQPQTPHMGESLAVRPSLRHADSGGHRCLPFWTLSHRFPPSLSSNINTLNLESSLSHCLLWDRIWLQTCALSLVPLWYVRVNLSQNHFSTLRCAPLPSRTAYSLITDMCPAGFVSLGQTPFIKMWLLFSVSDGTLHITARFYF